MPEGPEIRRAADKIASAIAGNVIEIVEFGLPRLKHYEEILSGSKVLTLETRGKALLTHFDNGLAIYSHNQLYGRWWVTKRGSYPNTTRSLRLALHTEKKSALLYSASDIEVLDEIGILNHSFLIKLGHDILDPNLHWKDIASRLMQPEFNNRSVGVLYLDQSFLAGVGNYLRSEILFDANINPRAKPKQLSRKVINQLARSTIEISQRAYSTGGITNTPVLVAKLKQQGLSRSRYRHAVFSRENMACYKCQQTIIKEQIASRRLYWCPLCQY
jgi:endonuclease-8